MNPMKFGESIEIGVSNRELEFTRLDDDEVDVRMCDGKPALSKDWACLDNVLVFPKDDSKSSESTDSNKFYTKGGAFAFRRLMEKSDGVYSGRMRPESVDDNEFSSKKDVLMDGLLAQKLDDIPSEKKKPDNNETKKVIHPAEMLENVRNTQIKNKKDEFNNMCAYYGATTGEFIEFADGSCKWISDDNESATTCESTNGSNSAVLTGQAPNGFDEWFPDDYSGESTPERRQMNRTARNVIVDNMMKTPVNTSNGEKLFYPTQKVGNPWTSSCQYKSNPELDELIRKAHNDAKEVLASEKIQGGCKESHPGNNSDMFSNIRCVNYPNTLKEVASNCPMNYTPQQQEFLDTIKNMKMDRNLTIKIKYNHENMKETRMFKFY